MNVSKLEKPAWKPYFDNVSKLPEGKVAEIEVVSLDLGSQPVAEWLPLFGVTYDARNDLIAVMGDGLHHMIRRPRDVFVQTEGVDLHSMEVIAGDGTHQLIKFRQPLLLSAPGRDDVG